MLQNELDGFVVYKPHFRATGGLFATISKSGIRFSYDVIKAMNTEWLLLFLDENKQRIMIQPAKKGTPNAVKLSSQGGRINTMVQKSVVEDIRDLAELKNGEKITVYGHKCNYATNPSIIFPLTKRSEQ